MIEVKGLEVRYQKHRALSNVNLTFASGKITTIIGPNGSGKTTLLRCIMGYMKPYAGEVLVKGKSGSDYKVKEFSKLVSYLPQFHHTPALVTVEQLVGYGRNPYSSFLSSPTSEDKETIEWAIKQTGLCGKQNHVVARLSGGERQRAFIAMNLAQKTKYLLLDEPINNLDIAYQLETLDMLRILNKDFGITIIMVLHDINLAARYSDNIAVLSEGRLSEHGKANDIITSEMLQNVFRIRADVEKRNMEIYIYPKNKED